MNNQGFTLHPRPQQWPSHSSRKPPRPSVLLPQRINLGGRAPSFVKQPLVLNLAPEASCSYSATASAEASCSYSATTSAETSCSYSATTSAEASCSSSATTSAESSCSSSAIVTTSPSYPAVAPTIAYDVFISFRGEDTRENFTSHLFASLRRSNILTFIDDEELRKGHDIAPSLYEAIEGSKISVVVLSKDYASSTWCLNELVKILECRRETGQIVLPVFYGLDPSDVRKQKGSFAGAFARHEEAFDGETVKMWRSALREVANLSGFDSRVIRPESKLVEEVVRCISEDLYDLSLTEVEGLVGVDSKIKAMNELLGNGLDDVRSIGIWGMGGVGKTSLAQAIFNRRYREFESYCFLANVREESERQGLISLRNELLRQILGETDINIATPDIGSRFLRNRLRRRRVLIILDDVSSFRQLEFLIKDPSCFGPGSRIIITTRDKDVLKSDVDMIYSMEGLADKDALELFSRHAFKQNFVSEEFLHLSYRVVAYAKGNPLALKVSGSFLHQKSIKEWESALSRLARFPDMETHNVLRISYDGLNDEEKEIFLDVACFFKGEDQNYVTNVLNGCDFSADIGIRSLIDKTLITTSGGRVLVHDLLCEMAMEIIRQESIGDPSRRSRLWSHEDISEVLTNETGTEAVRSISLNLSTHVEGLKLSPQAFTRMHNLRYLRFYGGDLSKENHKVCLPEGLECLPTKLRFLHWDGYPLKTLPLEFFPGNLVELQMHHSNLEQLWEGTVNLKHLRRIDVSHSYKLKRMPDISNAPNLQQIICRYCISLTSLPTLKRKLKHLELLDLSGCSNLKKIPEISWNVKELFLEGTAIEEIPPFIENFNQLVTLVMRNCKMLMGIPNLGHKLSSLKSLDLSGCSNVAKFPEICWNLEAMFLNETGIEEIPSSIEFFEKLTLLDLKNCTRFKSLPKSISRLKSLQELILSGCLNFDSFPEILEKMENLNYVCLDGTAIKSLPSSIENLSGLSFLDLENCKSLVSLPDGICNLKFLEDLNISGCSNLDSLPEGLGRLESLRSLRANGCKSQTVNLILDSLCSLKTLLLSDCGLSEFPDSLTRFSSLAELDLSRNDFESIPPSIKQLHELQSLDLISCPRIQSLPELPARLRKLVVLNCKSLEVVSSNQSSEFQLYPLNDVETYVFANCPNLKQDAINKIKAFAERRIRILASHLGIILNFGGPLSQYEWMTSEQMQYLFSRLYDYGDFHEALRGLYKVFFLEGQLSEDHPSALLSRILHYLHEHFSLDTQGLLGFFTLIAHLYLSCQGKPSTYFCFPGTDIPDCCSHQNDGSFIDLTVRLPQRSNKHVILVGFAMSALVAFEGYNDDKGFGVKCECRFHTSNIGTYVGTVYLRGWDGQEGKPVLVEEDHVCLGYDSALLVKAAKGLNKLVGYSKDLTEVSFKFHAVDEDGNPLKCCAVKKCGILPLYINDMNQSPKESLARVEITRGLTKKFAGFLAKVFGNLDLFGAMSLGILNVFGDLSVDLVHKGGYVYLVIKCHRAGVPIGLQIFNVHLGAPPLSVNLIDLSEHSEDLRTISIELSTIDEDNQHSNWHGVKNCKIRPAESHVMMCYVNRQEGAQTTG